MGDVWIKVFPFVSTDASTQHVTSNHDPCKSPHPTSPRVRIELKCVLISGHRHQQRCGILCCENEDAMIFLPFRTHRILSSLPRQDRVTDAFGNRQANRAPIVQRRRKDRSLSHTRRSKRREQNHAGNATSIGPDARPSVRRFRNRISAPPRDLAGKGFECRVRACLLSVTTSSFGGGG